MAAFEDLLELELGPLEALEPPTVVNLPHSPEILTPQKPMPGRKTLTEGLKLLLSQPISMAEKHALQAIDACHNIAGSAPQTFIIPNYLPILQRISAHHAKGTWEVVDNQLVFTEIQESSKSDGKNA